MKPTVSVNVDVTPQDDLTDEDLRNLGQCLIDVAKDALASRGSLHRTCGVCGESVSPNWPDACLGKLPGVGAACCGHGNPDDAYVSIGTGTHYLVLNGQDAVDWLREVREAVKK